MKESDRRLFLKENMESDMEKIKNLKSSEIEQLDDYVKAPDINELDIKLLIEKLNNLPYCLNKFLENKIKDQKGIFQLLEVRKRNIKIKINISKILNSFIICQWCLKNCCNYSDFLEKEINITETNIKICSCGVEDHEDKYYIIKKNIKLNSDEQKEIDKNNNFYYKKKKYKLDDNEQKEIDVIAKLCKNDDPEKKKKN